MRAHGIKPDPKLSSRRHAHRRRRPAGDGGAAHDAPGRPTAVVCSNDWTAIGALHAIDAAGLRVPEDISVVGFDDIPLASYTRPPLTSVRMSAGDVGSTAFDALFRLIGGERLEGDVYQVPTKLVVRASTAKPRR